MRLIYASTGTEVKIGDVVRLSDGEATVAFFRSPHKPSSSGKVSLEWPGDGLSEFYVGVIGAKWIEREDQSIG